MLLLAACYGMGCVSFLVLIGLMLVRQRPSGMGLAILVLYALTAIWALAATIQFWWIPGATHALDGLQLSGWLGFLALVFISASRKDGTPAGIVYTIVIPAICVLSVANDLRFIVSTTSPQIYDSSQVFCRIVVSLCGLLLVENLFRNTPPSRRWHTVPLCVAAGSLFAYDLFVFSDAVITRGVDPALQAGRGIVLALIVPPLIVTMARNQSWNIDIHVSRRVVFHTATLTGGGIFLLVAAGIASLAGQIPGDWGPLLAIAFFGASVIALAMVLSVGSLRSRLSRILSENFFSARYDYRAEWMRCIATLSSSDDDRDTLPARVIRALADIVDSPGGVLWLKDSDGSYRIAMSSGLSLEPADEIREGPFIAAFEGGKTVQVFSRDGTGAGQPEWVRVNPRVWIAVPLLLSEEIIGFVVLAQPRAPTALNWESFDLLLTIGRQGASWIAQELSSRALAQNRVLIEYNKRFSFVAHDVKNVSSQLGIMIANMKQFGDQAEFRADMIKTMEASIQRLNRLLDRLKPESARGPSNENTPDVEVLIEGVIRSVGAKSVKFVRSGESGLCCSIGDQDLQSVLTHVITNAVEASPPDAPITVELKNGERQAIITVEDNGCGMDPEFVKNELFVPLRTTKRHGHGIGAFQARELVRAAGGALEVVSSPNKGTMVKIALPRYAPGLMAGQDKAALQ